MFFFETNDDLGTVYAIELKCEECTKTTDDLHIKKIEILDQEFVYTFDINQIISVKDTLERFTFYYFLEKNAQF